MQVDQCLVWGSWELSSSCLHRHIDMNTSLISFIFLAHHTGRPSLVLIWPLLHPSTSVFFHFFTTFTTHLFDCYLLSYPPPLTQFAMLTGSVWFTSSTVLCLARVCSHDASSGDETAVNPHTIPVKRCWWCWWWRKGRFKLKRDARTDLPHPFKR